MRIFDCFLFFDELDLLELRLNVLNDIVDYFVIVESAITFQGDDKDFNFEKNKHRFRKFENKIIYFKVDKYGFKFNELPYIQNIKSADDKVLNEIFNHIDECPHFDKTTEFWWGNDFFQRECIRRALVVANPNPEDLIVISDVDEIPKPDTLLKVRDDMPDDTLVCFQQHEFCYYLNYYHNSNWVGTCCFIYSEFKDVSLNTIRFSPKRNEGLPFIIISNGGWHFTSMGGVESIRKKIQSWGHRELNTKATLASVEYNVRHGYDIFRRSGFGKMVSISIGDERLPDYLAHHNEDFKHLIGPRIESENVLRFIFYTSYFFVQAKLNSILRRFGSKFSI